MEHGDLALSPLGVDLESAIIHEELPDADIVHVFGEFSFVNAAHVEKAIVQSVHIGRTNVCDLLGCTYLDAAGVSVLIRARRALGSAFSLLAPESGIVRRVLEITELLPAA